PVAADLAVLGVAIGGLLAQPGTGHRGRVDAEALGGQCVIERVEGGAADLPLRRVAVAGVGALDRAQIQREADALGIDVATLLACLAALIPRAGLDAGLGRRADTSGVVQAVPHASLGGVAHVVDAAEARAARRRLAGVAQARVRATKLALRDVA